MYRAKISSDPDECDEGTRVSIHFISPLLYIKKKEFPKTYIIYPTTTHVTSISLSLPYISVSLLRPFPPYGQMNRPARGFFQKIK